MNKILAISLWQPWASLIAAGAKTYETRHWQTQYRGEFVICSAKYGLGKIELEEVLNRRSFQMALQKLLPDYYKGGKFREDKSFKAYHLPFGKAVAVVNLTGCRKTDSMNVVEHIRGDLPFGDFTPGRFAWKLENIRRIKEPFPVKGRQGFFNVELPEGVELIDV